MEQQQLKRDIIQKAKEYGAEIVRSCSVKCWDTEPLQPEEFRPANIRPWATNVIVIAIPLFFPMASTAPSMLYQEQYDTSNRITDNLAYMLAKYIVVEKKYRAFFSPGTVRIVSMDCWESQQRHFRM